MKKIFKLGEIADISTGLVLSRKQANEHNYIKKYKLLTVKSLLEGGIFNDEESDTYYSSEPLDDRYLTREGDVIIRLSHPNTGICINKEEEAIVISSLFAYIRLETDLVLAKYLSLYINSDIIKNFFHTRSRGISLKMVRTSDLKDMEIKVPSLEKQEKIIELQDYIHEEKKMLRKLLQEKEDYHRILINKILGEDHE